MVFLRGTGGGTEIVRSRTAESFSEETHVFKLTHFCVIHYILISGGFMLFVLLPLKNQCGPI
jgi:hypothetical protein